MPSIGNKRQGQHRYLRHHTAAQGSAAALDKLEQEGAITYGIHISSASIMSCYVRHLEDGHIHFVDGSKAGYTQAAKMLKPKLR
jgi:hypothetical protein